MAVLLRAISVLSVFAALAAASLAAVICFDAVVGELSARAMEDVEGELRPVDMDVEEAKVKYGGLTDAEKLRVEELVSKGMQRRSAMQVVRAQDQAAEAARNSAATKAAAAAAALGVALLAGGAVAALHSCVLWILTGRWRLASALARTGEIQRSSRSS